MGFLLPIIQTIFFSSHSFRGGKVLKSWLCLKSVRFGWEKLLLKMFILLPSGRHVTALMAICTVRALL